MYETAHSAHPKKMTLTPACVSRHMQGLKLQLFMTEYDGF